MKTKFLTLIIIIALYGCHNKSDQKQQMQRITKDKLYSNIIGSWQMCKAVNDNTEIAYNVCPIVVFSKEGLGLVNSAGKNTCKFDYLISDNKIIFSFKSIQDKKAFFAKKKELNFKISKKGKIKFLELKELNTNSIYILTSE